MGNRWVGVTDVLRYVRGADPFLVELDGYLNLHYITAAPDRSDPRLMLERGINVVATVNAPEAPVGRSSPSGPAPGKPATSRIHGTSSSTSTRACPVLRRSQTVDNQRGRGRDRRQPARQPGPVGLGVFVTTGSFSRQAQVEVIDDQYPLVMIPGKTLAREVRRLAFASHAGDIDAFLADTVKGYGDAVTHRRLEEILSS